jgi:hypothetical protein
MMILFPPDLSLATAQLAPVPVTMTLNLPAFFGIRILAIVIHQNSHQYQVHTWTVKRGTDYAPRLCTKPCPVASHFQQSNYALLCP